MPAAKMLSECIAEYLAWMVDNDLSANTVKTERYPLQAFLSQCGDMQARHLKPVHVEKVFKFWVKPLPGGDPPLARTLNMKRETLNRFFHWCERRRYLNHHEELTATIRRRKVTSRAYRYLTPQDLVDLLDLAKHPRDRALLALAMNTGLRQGEIVALKVKHLDLVDGWLDATMFKNKKEDRLPITADLDHEMRVWLTEYTRRCGALDPEWFLVPAKVPSLAAHRFDQKNSSVNHQMVWETAITPTAMFTTSTGVIRELLTRAGVYQPREGMHTLRRSAARVFYDAFLEDSGSADDAMSVTQSFLNHSSIDQTAKYIGVQRFKEKRNQVMHGRKIITRHLTDENVVPLKRVSDA